MKRYSLFFLPFLVFALSSFSQDFQPEGGMPNMPKISVTGKVVDASNGTPLEYATVILFSKRDNRQITGCVTAKDGTFSLGDLFPGQFRMTMKYLGYKAQTLEDVSPARGAGSLDLGVIRLQPAVLAGEKVDVQADRPEFEYKIDRRVINVGQQQTALSGTAVDVLENVPSVTVDVEGNIQLRGSSNFTVLIDNKPTPLESNEALQQTPASTIDQIEIITNPSAKYDPDGTAGIINIVTKKMKRLGITGIANMNLGLDDLKNRYGGDALFNLRSTKWTAFIGADYNKRSNPGSSRVDYHTLGRVPAVYQLKTDDNRWGGTGYGLRGGIDYSITEKDQVSAGFRIGNHNHERNSEGRSDLWTEPGNSHTLYRSKDESDRDGNHYEMNLDYRHNFSKPGHEVLAQIIYEGEKSDDKETNKQFNAADAISFGQQSSESGPSKEIRLKLDYTLPMRANEKLQAGYQNRIESGDEAVRRYDYDTTSIIFVFQPRYSYDIDFTHSIQSVYGTYSNEYKKLGYQAGVRGEYTGRNIDLKGADQTFKTFKIDRWDFFPTGHLSYTFSQGKQIMASYTRRVQRPRDWDLEPFETWMDAYNVRRGNPNLQPEFIDSYETTFQSTVGQSVFSIDAYYKVTNNKMERIQSLYDTSWVTMPVNLNTIDNIGKDYSFGSEIMLNVSPVKPWNLNLMGNLYQYRVKGELFGEAFSRESFNWSLRFNNTLKITPSTRLQANGMYNSPSVSSQGSREGNFMVNFGLRQEFFNRALSATLQVRDAFKTGAFEFSTTAPDFYNHVRFTRRAPLYTLTLTFNINNYKQDKPRENGEQIDNGRGGEEEGQY
jgi:outer membrane receptor protein involved in Fe transport